MKFIHLSDLHYSSQDKHFKNKILDPLIEDITKSNSEKK